MINTNILKSDIETVKSVLDYFAAEFDNSVEWSKIKEHAISVGKKFNSPNSEKFVSFGFLSVMDCTLYLSENGHSNSGRVIDETFNALEEKLLIYPIDRMLSSRLTDIRYRLNGTLAYNLYKTDLILNTIMGFEYIINSYKKSVIKIEPTLKNDVKSIGTGFLVEYDKDLFVITNKHVVEEYKKLNLYDINDLNIKYETIFLNPNKDIALITLKDFYTSKPFLLNTKLNLLDEIITIGYPSVPMTKFSYQIYHKGEINSFVQDYSNNDLILISAKTSSGNSGSPVIDSTGRVIGVVTQELFEEEEFYKKGKLPYYAALSAKDIIETIQLFKKTNETTRA